jgi:hypothetical protein
MRANNFDQHQSSYRFHFIFRNLCWLLLVEIGTLFTMLEEAAELEEVFGHLNSCINIVRYVSLPVLCVDIRFALQSIQTSKFCQHFEAKIGNLYLYSIPVFIFFTRETDLYFYET